MLSETHGPEELDQILDDYLKENSIQPLEYSKPDQNIESQPKTIEEDEGRYNRALGQYELETNIEQLYDKSALERLIIIREKLYADVDEVHGVSPLAVRDVSVRTSVFVYPRSKEVSRAFLPNYIKALDEEYDAILEESDSAIQAEKSVRLAAVAYTLGILMHPYIDGNGQSLRTLSESYLKEFNPSFNDLFFKFKLDSSKGTSLSSVIGDEGIPQVSLLATLEKERVEYEQYLSISRVRELIGNSTEIPFSLNGLRAMFLLKKMNPDITSLSSASEYLSQREAEFTETIPSNTYRLKDTYSSRLEELAEIRSGYVWPTLPPEGEHAKLNMRDHRQELTYLRIKEYFEKTRKGDYAFLQNLNSNNILEAFLEEKAFLQESINERLDLIGQGRELEAMLNVFFSMDGLVGIHEYISKGTIEVDIKYKDLATKIFENFVEDISADNVHKYMESFAEHEQRVQEIKQHVSSSKS